MGGWTIWVIRICSSLDSSGCELCQFNFSLSKPFLVTISLRNLAKELFGIRRSFAILWVLDGNLWSRSFKLLRYSGVYHVRLGLSNQEELHTSENMSTPEFCGQSILYSVMFSSRSLRVSSNLFERFELSILRIKLSLSLHSKSLTWENVRSIDSPLMLAKPNSTSMSIWDLLICW